MPDDDPLDAVLAALAFGAALVVVDPALDAPVDPPAVDDDPEPPLAAGGAGAAAAIPTEPPSTAVSAVAKAPTEASDRLASRRLGTVRTSGNAALFSPTPTRMRWRVRRGNVSSTQPLLITPANFLLKVSEPAADNRSGGICRW